MLSGVGSQSDLAEKDFVHAKKEEAMSVEGLFAALKQLGWSLAFSTIYLHIFAGGSVKIGFFTNNQF